MNLRKIIKLVLVESLEFRQTGWTSQPWGGSTMRRWRSMSLRQTIKLGLVASLVFRVTELTSLRWAGSTWRRCPNMPLRRITKLGLEASMGFRLTGWTRLQLAGITMKRWTSMRARPSRLITRQGLLDMVIEMMWLDLLGQIMSKLNLTFLQEMPRI